MVEELITEYYALESKVEMLWKNKIEKKEQFCSLCLEELEIFEDQLRNHHYHELNSKIEHLRSKLLMELII